MCEVDSDILETERLLSNYSNSKKYHLYDKIYYSSNEWLDEIFSNFDFYGKNVLSVLGSGDQAFHLYNRGCKSVDVFDINKLTLYYYYLRIWTIKYFCRYYPDEFLNTNFIKELLNSVKVCDSKEERAYNYWRKFIDVFDGRDCESLLRKPSPLYSNRLEYLGFLRDSLMNIKFDFYNSDISNGISTDKKYDCIFQSNVNDYIHKDEASLRLYMNHLNDLLKNDGMIISTLVTTSVVSKSEKEVFSELFNCYDIWSDNLPIAYVYQKK